MASSIPYVSSDAVRKTLSMIDLIPLMERAMVNFSRGAAGGVVQPLRETISIKEKEGFLFTMPAYSAQDRVLATKLVTLFPHNRETPTHHGTIVLMSAEDGSVLSILDAEVITEMRTAAVSAVATKYLAPPKASKLGIIGSGIQAKSHLDALKHVRSFEEIRVWSPNRSRLEAFAKEHGVTACATAEEAVNDCDVIVTATLAKTPVLFKNFVKEGAHVNAVGAPRPDQRELDGELVRSSHVVVDSRVGALKEAGDVILNDAGDRIVAELGEVAAGGDALLDSLAGKTTIFKNLGMAVQDAVAAQFVFEKLMGR